MIDLRSVRTRLAATAGAVLNLLEGVAPDEVRWKPSPERWSILEVLNHLADEEVEDFRARLEILVHRPADPFPPIDPQGWVTSRRYAERDFGQSLNRFLDEREESLRWLDGLDPRELDLDLVKVHPGTGRLSGRCILACWAAHDLLHIRQLTRLRYDYLVREAHPESVAYAGTWV